MTSLTKIQIGPLLHITRSPLLALALALSGCSATPAQVSQTFTDGWKVGECVIGLVLSGVTDVAQLLQCSGATEQLVVDIIADWQAKHAATAEQTKLLEQAKTNAKVSLAKKASK